MFNLNIVFLIFIAHNMCIQLTYSQSIHEYQHSSNHETSITKIVKRATTPDCQIPTNRFKLIIKNFNLDKTVQVGESVPYSHIVTFQCPTGYTLKGVSQTYCDENGNWRDFIPDCINYCSEAFLKRVISIEATCFYYGIKVPCTKILPDTRAQISCAFGYQRPGIVGPYTTLRCTENFEWVGKITPCEMKCGIVPAPLTPFIEGGTDVNVTEVPWNVGIYQFFNERSFEPACSGVIISPHIVLSAAHCFWDAANSTLYDKSYYGVAAGNYLQNYYSKDPANIGTQKFNILQIIIQEGFKGRSFNYLYDLAIVVLEGHFTFTSAVNPICLHFHKTTIQGKSVSDMATDISGYVAGWARNDSNNRILKKVSLRTLSIKDCELDMRSRNIYYNLAKEKFCASTVNDDDNLCRGDSGAGFFIEEKISGEIVYRLIGIVSHSPMYEIACAQEGVIVFTNVQHFRDFILANFHKIEHEAVNRRNLFYERVVKDEVEGLEGKLQPGDILYHLQTIEIDCVGNCTLKDVEIT